MKRWLHKIEVIIDILIPFMLLILLAIIIIEIGFHEISAEYSIPILVLDSIAVAVFTLDLIFKFIRVKKIPKFIRTYWLDIIAIFPFFLVFRAFEGILILFSRSVSEGVSTAQTIMHEGVQIEKEITKVGKISRTSKFMKFIRPLFRAPRFAKSIHFFSKPTGEHHSE